MIAIPPLLLSLAQRVPKSVLVAFGSAIAVVGLLWGAVALVQNYGAREYARGRKDAFDQANVHAGVVQIAAAAQRIAQTKTDSVRHQVKRATAQLEPAIAAVPADVRALPPVKHLIAVSMAIKLSADSLDQALLAERAATHMRAQVDSAARISAMLGFVARGDTIADLRARPTKLQAAATAVGTGLVGFLMGMFSK